MLLFVSYRRDDTVAESGAIFRLLKEQIDNPSVVTDTSSISTGAERSGELRSVAIVRETRNGVRPISGAKN